MTEKGKKRVRVIIIFMAFFFLFLLIMAIAPNTYVPLETQAPAGTQTNFSATSGGNDSIESIIEVPKASSAFSVSYNGKQLASKLSRTQSTEVTVTSNQAVLLEDLDIRGTLPILGEVSFGESPGTSAFNNIITYKINYDTEALGDAIAGFMTESVLNMFEAEKSGSNMFFGDDFSEITLTKIKASYLPYNVQLEAGDVYGEVSMELVGMIDYIYSPERLPEPKHVTDCSIRLLYIYDDDSGEWVMAEYENEYAASLPRDISSNYLTTELS